MYQYFYVELDASGEPKGTPVKMAEASVFFRIGNKLPRDVADNLVAIARENDAHPVDLVQWDATKTTVLWSARITRAD